ncbi:hypothetical protein IFM89_031777 [Coptis chinensis]|uniref:F-box domain-containing protein n=1 Tax=Coptis chinensis TaxID=261450 RepID=A0A835H3U0_9MAGN|nr:hypothetical protein IFM89_031777 [Coptis chinensis]
MEKSVGVETMQRVTRYEESQRKRTQEITGWNFPEEITSNILSKLHIRFLMQCRCVSRSWRTLISDPIFIHMHLTHRRTLHLNNIEDNDLVIFVRDGYLPRNIYMVEHVDCSKESVKSLPVLPSHLSKYQVVDSCNGLLCLRNLTLLNRLIHIWNPFTGEILDIPLSPNLMTSRIIAHFGFGYDSTHNEYKVLAISNLDLLDEDNDNTLLVVAEVWTLGSGSWRSIGKVPFLPVDQHFSTEGSLHWMSYESYESDAVGIGSFDIRNEEFQFVSLPLHMDSALNHGFVDTGPLGGCISVVDYYSSPGRAEIWLMKHLGRQESWTKQFVIPMTEDFQYIKLLCLLKGGDILFVYNGAKLVSCDPRNGQIREVGRSCDSQDVELFIDRFVFVGTLVSPIMIGGGVE